MAEYHDLKISIRSRNNHDLVTTQGSLNVVVWNKNERTKNAIKVFGMFLGITFGCIFVPFWHYFLVPALLVTTFVMSLDKLSQEKEFTGGTGLCPKCKTEIIFQKSKYKDRITDTCEKCFEEVVATV